VKVRLPNGAHVKKVHLLVADHTPRAQHHGPELAVTVPSVLDHEVVAIDL
jgi:hypothetical protein